MVPDAKGGVHPFGKRIAGRVRVRQGVRERDPGVDGIPCLLDLPFRGARLPFQVFQECGNLGRRRRRPGTLPCKAS
jgi:hypothetical protein